MSTLVREENAAGSGGDEKNTRRRRIDSLYKVVCDITQCICGRKCKSLKGHSDSFYPHDGKTFGLCFIDHISRQSIHIKRGIDLFFCCNFYLPDLADASSPGY